MGTLAGGVAVGACADMMLSPFGAVLMGAMAGFVSVLGFEYTQPFLAQKMKTHDTLESITFTECPLFWEDCCLSLLLVLHPRLSMISSILTEITMTSQVPMRYFL